MTKLYKKSELAFAILWIIVYVVGTSIAESISDAIGVKKLVTLIFHIIITAVIMMWLSRNNLLKNYGICKASTRSSNFLFYIPLIIIISTNLWFGINIGFPMPESVFFVCSMLCVGFLEEIIFRGLLFCAMKKDGIRAAVIVSSLTFGAGHIINLINGSGASLTSNICQICYAAAIGFLFVIMFIKSGSLIPQILTHGVFNALSVLSNTDTLPPLQDILLSVFLTIVPLIYALIIIKKK